jgi:hypothetical protein
MLKEHVAVAASGIHAGDLPPFDAPRPFLASEYFLHRFFDRLKKLNKTIALQNVPAYLGA